MQFKCASSKPEDAMIVSDFSVCLVEKELNFGDHGYARRNPLPGLEEEDADRTRDDQQPCTQCQLLKKQLEQETQRTARLQREVGEQLLSVFTVYFIFCVYHDSLVDLNTLLLGHLKKNK